MKSYVREHVQVLKEQDSQVRKGMPNSVHLMRIATRRLRSAMAIYRKILDRDFVNNLREELKWLGLILGTQRDAEVMRQRIRELIAAEPTELDLELTRWIDEQLEADFAVAHLAVLKTLDDERYSRLLEGLDVLLTAPLLTDLASKPTKKIVSDLVRNDWKRLRRAVRASEKISISHDFALHEVRKCAKGLRYTTEIATLAHLSHANRLAEAAEQIQTILGDYHDSVVARALLRRLGTQAHARGLDDFNYGWLYAFEERNAERSEIQFRKAWKHFPSGSLKM